MHGIETLSAALGNKILAAGAHTINIQGFVSRDATTTITAATINGVAHNAAALAAYWPEGTVFGVGELFLFAATDEVTAITVGGATGSITAIRA